MTLCSGKIQKVRNPHRAEYLDRCKKLLGVAEPKVSDSPELDGDPDDTPNEAKGPPCPKCGRPMKCVEMIHRPSWKVTMNSVHRPSWYSRSERYSDSLYAYASSHPP